MLCFNFNFNLKFKDFLDSCLVVVLCRYPRVLGLKHFESMYPRVSGPRLQPALRVGTVSGAYTVLGAKSMLGLLLIML